jgi:hypothetical protein
MTSVALPGLGETLTSVPVVLPPAKLFGASGTKTYIETNGYRTGLYTNGIKLRNDSTLGAHAARVLTIKSYRFQINQIPRASLSTLSACAPRLNLTPLGFIPLFRWLFGSQFDSLIAASGSVI